MKNILKLALILTAIGILLSLIYRYALGPDFLFTLKGAGVSILITIILSIVLGRKYLRDPEEGRLGYGQAVKKLFMAFLVSLLLSGVFNCLMYANNEEMKESYRNYEIEMQESGARLGARMAGQSEAEQEAAIDKIRELRESGEIQPQSYPFAWHAFALTFVNGVVVYLLLALLLALFVREKETQHA